MLAALLRPAAALGGARADRSRATSEAENSNHQVPGAGAGVGPRPRQGPKLRLGVRDLLDDGEQVEGAARSRSIGVTVTTSPGVMVSTAARAAFIGLDG